MMKRIALTLAAGALAAVASAPQAHVVLERRSAVAGTYYKAVFMVGHGCEGAATTAIRVQIPDGVSYVKPMDKPGWTLETRTAALAKPVSHHGRTLTESVVEIVWRGGRLADDRYDEFVALLRLPKEPGKIYFKVLQACEVGEHAWVEVPAAGAAARKLERPAAELELTVPSNSLSR
jgi:uncharacterized protein YcnI